MEENVKPHGVTQDPEVKKQENLSEIRDKQGCIRKLRIMTVSTTVKYCMGFHEIFSHHIYFFLVFTSEKLLFNSTELGLHILGR